MGNKLQRKEAVEEVEMKVLAFESIQKFETVN